MREGAGKGDSHFSRKRARVTLAGLDPGGARPRMNIKSPPSSHLPDIVMAELARDPFEAGHRAHFARA